MQNQTHLAGGVIYINSENIDLEELYKIAKELKNYFNFKLLYVRQAGRDKNAIELITEVGENSLNGNLDIFKQLASKTNELSNDSVLGYDIATGLNIVKL